MSVDLCKSFRDEAGWVWNRMGDGQQLRISLQEETVTEMLLLRLAKKHNGRDLNITTFTKAQEAKNGADWEFWIANCRGLGLRLRVQAKRLYRSGRYEALELAQCRKLIGQAGQAIPIYAFFNFAPAFTYSNSFSYHCHRFRPSSYWGVSVAMAHNVSSVLSRNPQDKQASKFNMAPWHCLVCPCCWDDRPADTSLPSLIGNGLKQLYSYSIDDGGEDLATPADLGISFEPTNNAPTWVQVFGEGQDVVGSLEEEMGRLNLKGVAIIKEAEARDG